MATTLKIYKTQITPQRNAKIDNIGNYLSTCQVTYTDDNFQYIKPQLDMAINIDVSGQFSSVVEQGNASLLATLGNYATLNLDSGSAKKTESVVYYYFILEARWISDETVALKCSLDTINTF